MTALELAKFAAKAASGKQAGRIVILDLRSSSDICDFQVICSGMNNRQTKAIAQAIHEGCQVQFGIKPLAVEGMQNGHWILLDYGATIIHIFFSTVRDFYALEELFPKAQFVDPGVKR